MDVAYQASFACVTAQLSLPAGECIAITQHGKDTQDIVNTWSCCGAAGCKAAGAAGLFEADACADPEGACMIESSWNQTFVYSGM